MRNLKELSRLTWAEMTWPERIYALLVFGGIGLTILAMKIGVIVATIYFIYLAAEFFRHHFTIIIH